MRAKRSFWDVSGRVHSETECLFQLLFGIDVCLLVACQFGILGVMILTIVQLWHQTIPIRSVQIACVFVFASRCPT